MENKSFATLSQEAQRDWTNEAKLVYAAASHKFRDELSMQASFGEALVAARKELKLSQQAVADLSGVQQAEISRIERGQGNPTSATLGKLASALKLKWTLSPA